MPQLPNINLDEFIKKYGECLIRTPGTLEKKTFWHPEMRKYMSPITNVKDVYRYDILAAKSMLQKYNCEWKPTGGFEGSTQELKNYEVKYDFEYCPRDYQRSHLMRLNPMPGQDPYIMPFEAFMKACLEDKMMQDIEQIVNWDSVYDPSPDAPPSPYNVANGWFQRFAEYRSKGQMGIKPTGPKPEDNIDVIAWIEGFLNNMPTWMKKVPTVLWSSCDVFNCYKLGYRDKFQKTPDLIQRSSSLNRTGNQMDRVIKADCFDVTFCPIQGMGDSDGLVLTVPDNARYVIDQMEDMSMSRVEKNKRRVCCFGDFNWGLDMYCKDPRILCSNDMLKEPAVYAPEDIANMGWCPPPIPV